MFFSRPHYTHPEFRQGISEMWPQVSGIAA